MSAAIPPSTDSSSKEDRLKQCLLDRAKDGKMYFKSEFVADDVDPPSKEIGALMAKLRDSATGLSIEKWSYTSTTAWRVETA